jgi:hypothetical protein
MSPQHDGRTSLADKHCNKVDDECAGNRQRSYYDEHEFGDDYGADDY